MTGSASGQRVGAILSVDNGCVYFLGYGCLAGEEIPFGAVGDLARHLVGLEQTNPKIVLNSGKVVWGCECWWDDEDVVMEILMKSDRVVKVDIDELRKEYLDSMNEEGS